ncbi:MAG TPA: serine hydrolase domain-containing protein [Candidatus Limnocylindrales bacterium]|nr:serine hydrolase domain-containing protein [Candidatus Limnocylindrales bacterium]
MAATQPRRAGARRAILISFVAVATAIATVTLGPVLSGQRSAELIGASTATSSPAPSPSPWPSATPAVSATALAAATATATPTPSPILAPTPIPPPSADPYASTLPSAGPTVLPTIPAPTRTPIDYDLTYPTRLALQTRLDVLRERYAIPGISVAIVMPNGSTWLGVSGLADVAADRPVTPSTSFAIASISKTFTAALIMALVEEGKIKLDAPVRRYLPGLKKVGSKILVSQLLDHTSGLRDYFFHASIDHALLADPDRRWDARMALRYVGKAYFKPGAGWHYSNTNYLVLGLLAEAVGHEPLGKQIRTRFLAPLDLDRTWYQPAESTRKDAAHGYRFNSAARDAKAIDLSDGSPIVPFTSVITAAGSAGGYASDARDLALWVRALYGGQVLAPATVERMTDVTVTASKKARVPYGLGVQVIDVDGRRTFGHSGRLLGFRSTVRYLPDEGVSIAVLTNQSRVDPAPILRSLLRVALTPDRTPCRCFDRP